MQQLSKVVLHHPQVIRDVANQLARMLLSAVRAKSLNRIFLPVLMLEPLLGLEHLSAGCFLAVGGHANRLIVFHRRRLCLGNTGGSSQQCIVRMLLGRSNSALCQWIYDGVCFVFLYRNADDPLGNTVLRFFEYLLRRLVGH